MDIFTLKIKHYKKELNKTKNIVITLNLLMNEIGKINPILSPKKYKEKLKYIMKVFSKNQYGIIPKTVLDKLKKETIQIVDRSLNSYKSRETEKLNSLINKWIK